MSSEQTVTGQAWIEKSADMDKIVTHVKKIIRDLLRVSLTDPINRGADWVFIAFPRRDIVYPLIAISQPSMTKKQMGGNDTLIEEGTIALDISIFSKTTSERDKIADAVLAVLKLNMNYVKDYGLLDMRVATCYDAEFDETKEVFRKIAVIQFGIVG